VGDDDLHPVLPRLSFALQRAHHFSALHTGLAFLPAAVATIAGAQAGSRALARVNARIVAVTGLALAAAGYAVAAHWTQPAALARHRRAIAASAAGLAAITAAAVTAAAVSGAAFVSNGQVGASMAMAVLTGVALLCYLANLLMSGPPATISPGRPDQ
jgi:hypothetical protein